MAGDDWTTEVARLASEVQDSCANLRWMSAEAGPSPQGGARKKRKKGENGKGGGGVAKYKVDFEERTLEVVEEGSRGGAAEAHDLEDLLSLAATAVHTQDPKRRRLLDETCEKIAAENGIGGGEGDGSAQAWLQEVLSKAYCVKTLLRKTKGWKVRRPN